MCSLSVFSDRETSPPPTPPVEASPTSPPPPTMSTWNENMTASCSIANIIKSSLGSGATEKPPIEVKNSDAVNNDGATILKLLEIQHPAARILVDYAQLQEDEVGDGTTSLVVFAAELLKNADKLLKDNVSVSAVIDGYRLAHTEAKKYIQSHLMWDVEKLKDDTLLNIAKTAHSSSYIADHVDFFGRMAVIAAKEVKFRNEQGCIKCPVSAVSILKARGLNPHDSFITSGYAISHSPLAETLPRHIRKARIACLDFSLHRLKLNSQLFHLEKPLLIDVSQIDYAKEISMKIVKLGANVVLVTGCVDEKCIKYFIERRTMVGRRVSGMDMRRICKATGATILDFVVDNNGAVILDSLFLGEAEKAMQIVICNHEHIVIEGPKMRPASSILLRGTDSLCEKAERFINDAFSALKSVYELKEVVVGGGAVEVALSVYLETLAESLSPIQKSVILEYSQALLVIPRTLVENSSRDGMLMTTQLVMRHMEGTKKNAKMNKWYGIDLNKGEVSNNLCGGILEAALTKMKSLNYGTEAAVQILRADDVRIIDIEDESEEMEGDAERKAAVDNALSELLGNMERTSMLMSTDMKNGMPSEQQMENTISPLEREVCIRIEAPMKVSVSAIDESQIPSGVLEREANSFQRVSETSMEEELENSAKRVEWEANATNRTEQDAGMCENHTELESEIYPEYLANNKVMILNRAAGNDHPMADGTESWDAPFETVQGQEVSNDMDRRECVREKKAGENDHLYSAGVHSDDNAGGGAEQDADPEIGDATGFSDPGHN